MLDAKLRRLGATLPAGAGESLFGADTVCLSESCGDRESLRTGRGGRPERKESKFSYAVAPAESVDAMIFFLDAMQGFGMDECAAGLVESEKDSAVRADGLYKKMTGVQAQDGEDRK